MSSAPLSSPERISLAPQFSPGPVAGAGPSRTTGSTLTPLPSRASAGAALSPPASQERVPQVDRAAMSAASTNAGDRQDDADAMAIDSSEPAGAASVQPNNAANGSFATARPAAAADDLDPVARGLIDDGSPGWGWKNERAQEETSRCLDQVLDRGFSLKKFGDPFENRAVNGSN